MDRRKFLKTSAFGVALATTPSLLASVSLNDAPAVVRTPRSTRLKLTFEPYELKLRHSFNLATSQRTTTPDVQVQIECDGIVGYGEASMPPYLGESVDSVCKFLNSLDLSQFNDPFRIEDILDYMEGVAPDNRAAKASVDIALHDLIGKIMGQPWYKIWGLNPELTPNTSFTVSYDADPSEMKAKVEDTSPFKVVKIKMGLDHDKQTVEAVRQYTSVPICVDANQGWTDKEKALEMCGWLAERNCLFVEQPLPKNMVEETAWLRERSPLPIIADESVQRLADVKRVSETFDGINIKLMKSTGMHEAYQMAVLARALGMKVMIGCMTETSCAVTAASHLSPMADWADLDGNLLIANDRFKGMEIVDGKVTLTDSPGLGVTLI